MSPTGDYHTHPLSIKYDISPQLIPLTFFFLLIHCHLTLTLSHNTITLYNETHRTTLPSSVLQLHFHLANPFLSLFQAHHTLLLTKALIKIVTNFVHQNKSSHFSQLLDFSCKWVFPLSMSAWIHQINGCRYAGVYLWKEYVCFYFSKFPRTILSYWYIYVCVLLCKLMSSHYNLAFLL